MVYFWNAACSYEEKAEFLDPHEWKYNTDKMIPLETMKQIFMVDFLQKLLALFWKDNSEMVTDTLCGFY